MDAEAARADSALADVAPDARIVHASIDNAGDPYDGHAPSRPVGTGTGLFCGDELNANQVASNPANDGHGWSLRAFVTFIHGQAIPAGATVISARLIATQSAVQGDPYAGLGGALHVDHLDYGDALVPTSYDAPALQADIGILSMDGRFGRTAGRRDLDVTAAVIGDVAAARGRTQFRFRFPLQSDDDSQTDLAIFSPPGDPNSHTPGTMRLEIDMTAP